MKRKPIWVAIGLILLVALGIGSMMPWTLSGTSIRHQLGEQIRTLTGLALENAGRTTISVLPRPRIKVESVELRDPDDALSIDARSVRGDLRILPLLLGRIEVASIQLRIPTIFVDLDGRPMAREGTLARAADTPSASPAASEIDSTRLGIVTIESGLLRLRSKARGLETLFENVDMTLDWRSVNRPASLVGTAEWRGRQLNLSAWLGRPAALLRGEPSAINMKIQSAQLSLAASGTLTTGDRFAYEGKLNASTTNLPALARLLPVPVDVPDALANSTLAAKVSVVDRAVDLSDLRMSLGGNAFEGSLAMRRGEDRPLISGTLATESISLAPFAAPMPSPVASDGRWSRETLPVRLDLADVDLRVSASKARLGRLEFSDAALALILNNGRFEFSVGDARAYGGTFKLRLSATQAPGGQTMRCVGAFNKIDAGAMLASGWHMDRLSGSASGQFTCDSSGTTLGEIMQNMNGQARLSLLDGEISGLDIEQALRRVDKRPLSIGGEMRSGRTGFTSADGFLDITNGIATLRDFNVTGPGASLLLSGSARLGDRSLDIKAIARQSGETGRTGPQLRMDVRGSFDDPRLVLDAASLIRRSEAAAPLFGEPPSASPAPAPTPVPAETAPAARAP